MSSKDSEPFSLDYEEMEFKVEREDWNEYELNTGARIKVRILLSQILRDPNNPKNMSFGTSSPIWAIYAPEHLRGIPSTDILSDPTKRAAQSKYKVLVEKNHEPWNVYKILRTGQELKLKLTVDDVYQFKDVYDGKGSPLYHVPHGVTVLVKDNEPDQGS